MRCISDDSLAIRSAARTGAAKITLTVPVAVKCTVQTGVLTVNKSLSSGDSCYSRGILRHPFSIGVPWFPWQRPSQLGQF